QKRGVRFLVVGGHALIAHGRPRPTGGLDLVVDRTADNARRIGLAMTDLGFKEVAAECHRVPARDRMARMGRPEKPILVMSNSSGVSFPRAWKGRFHAPFGELEVDFLGLEDIVRNKRMAKRPKDLEDLEKLLPDVLKADTARWRRRVEQGGPGGPRPRRKPKV